MHPTMMDHPCGLVLWTGCFPLMIGMNLQEIFRTCFPNHSIAWWETLSRAPGS